MPNVIDLSGVADEGEGSLITATFYDKSGDPLEADSILSLELTLQNETDGAIINERDASNILNQNGGTVEADGTLKLKLSGDDNAIIARNGYKESHIATIEWSWEDFEGDPQQGRQKWRLRVAPKKTERTLERGWVG